MCVCVRLDVCVPVISEFSRTGPRSATPLPPTWRASSGELQQLHLESTGHVLREKKPLELFAGNAGNNVLRVTTVQYLRNGSSS